MVNTKELSKWLDGKIKFKKLIGGVAGAVAEASDNLFFRYSFDFAVSKVPEEHHANIQKFIDGIVSKDLSAVGDITSDYIVSLLKTPFGDGREEIVVDGLLDIVLKLIAYEEKEILSVAPSTVGGGGPGGHPEGKEG